jgi:hypothetical protein
MAFGFDPSIILSGLPRPPPESSFNDTLQSLAGLASQRMQEQMHQASLAEMLRKQGQERTLADIYRANAKTPGALPAVLRGAGFGQQAAAEEDQAAQMATSKREAEAAYRKRIAEHFYDTTDEADYEARRQELAASQDPMLSMFASTMPKYDAAYVKRLGGSAISPEKRANIAAMAGRSQPTLATDENGNQFVVNLRNPEAPATPVMAPGGTQLRKPPPAGRGGGGGAAGGSPKEWKDLKNDLSTGARGSLSKDLQKSINSAEALETLLRLPNGSFTKATPEQMHEAYTSLNSLISKGGSQAASQIEALVPETLASKWAKLKQKVLNEPQSADAEAFIENILDTTKREATLARKQLRRQQLQALPNYAHLRKADPVRFESMLRAPGIEIDPATIDEKGLEVASPTGVAALHPGEVLMLDTKGKPHAVAEKDVADAEAHKWKRAKP